VQVQAHSEATDWSRPPAFPSGAGGLLSTVDDFLAFARLLLNKGIHDGGRLLSESPVPGRYGWAGGYGTSWFNHPELDLVAIAMTQTSDLLFRGALTEFDRLVCASF